MKNIFQKTEKEQNFSIVDFRKNKLKDLQKVQMIVRIILTVIVVVSLVHLAWSEDAYTIFIVVFIGLVTIAGLFNQEIINQSIDEFKDSQFFNYLLAIPAAFIMNDFIHIVIVGFSVPNKWIGLLAFFTLLLSLASYVISSVILSKIEREIMEKPSPTQENVRTVQTYSESEGLETSETTKTVSEGKKYKVRHAEYDLANMTREQFIEHYGDLVNIFYDWKEGKQKQNNSELSRLVWCELKNGFLSDKTIGKIYEAYGRHHSTQTKEIMVDPSGNALGLEIKAINGVPVRPNSTMQDKKNGFNNINHFV